MKNSLLILLSLLPLTVLGADVQDVRIEDFSLGLNTAQKATKLQPGEAVKAHNVDLTKNPGGLTVRDGYDLSINFPGSDSILTNGLITYTLRNGDRRLVVLTDSSGAGYGTAYISDANTITFNFGGDTDGLDTIKIVPDTASALLGARTFSSDSVIWRLDAWTDECSGGLMSIKLDSADNPSVVVDSFVARFESTSACTTYADFVDAGDTIFYIEKQTSYTLYVNGQVPGPYAGWFNITYDGLSPTAVRRLPLTGQIQYAQHNGDLYIVNGVSAGLVFDDATSRRFPVKAPGEVDAIPVLVDSNGIPGVYRYAVKYLTLEASSGDSLVQNQFSVLSGEIEACDSCGVLLSGFQPPNDDQWLTDDTVTVQIWRTTALSRYIDKADTIWNTGVTLSFDALSGYGAIEVLDTISDDSLRNSTGVIYMDGEWYSYRPDSIADPEGPDTNYIEHYPKPGAPTILSTDTSVSDSGIWSGIGNDWDIAAGWSWFVVKVDTILGIASDSSRTASMYQEGKPIAFDSAYAYEADGDSIRLAFGRGTTERVKLVIPRTEDSGFIYLLYRGLIKPLSFDTSTQKVLVDSVNAQEFGGEPRFDYVYKDKKSWYGEEFIALDYRLIGQYNPGDTVTDSIGYAAFLTRTPYRRNRIPGRVKDVMSFDGILYLADDQNVYTSTSYDTTLNFSALNQRPIGPEDGGVINAIWPDRNFVKVGKTNRVYNLYEIDRDLFGSAEVSNNFGVIAPYSSVTAPEGQYILSLEGAWLLSDGLYQARQNNVRNMSLQLNNFVNKPISSLSRAFGFYWDNKLFYSIGDTTYVLNKVESRAGYQFGWTTWGLPISAATRYRVATDGNVPDTLYFSKPGEAAIYRLGANVQDADENGDYTPIDWKWQSGALGFTGWEQWQPTELVYNAYTDNTASLNLSIYFYNAKDALNGAATVGVSAIDTASVYRHELGTIGESPYWYIYMETNNPYGWAPTPNTETTIEGIYLRLLRRGDI